ncbi:VWA domain-containing protein [Streptomyces scabiei]|uniref:VWA domain-containing protein n=1 Tax=Streptomyces scabiei TaxID=1930 RepID=UPI00117C3EDF|nr:VWA domain-containing protein [Streptomyces scabiei]
MRLTTRTTPDSPRVVLTAPPRRVRLAAAAALTVATTMTACSGGSSPHGELARDKQTLASCDTSAPPASDIQIDGSGSSASKTITEERMAAIEQIVRTTAICSGRLRVSVFSASSAGTVTLFDGPLPLDGATANARLKRVSTVVDDAITEIRDAYGPAVAGLKGKGSDITAQYRLAGEWINQVGDNFRLSLVLLTDGFQNVGVDLGKRAVSKTEATALANKTDVPKLPGASITVAGLGRVAGAPPRSDVVEGLVTYYDALCKKTGAAKCVSVTDYASEGR